MYKTFAQFILHTFWCILMHIDAFWALRKNMVIFNQKNGILQNKFYGLCLLEWIPKWQNKIDAWFSGRLFSKMARKSWIFHISHNRKLCMGQKWQKLQIQDLLNEVYPKGLIFKMTLFSPIDLDKIMPKNPK